jgi:hypothetical protein
MQERTVNSTESLLGQNYLSVSAQLWKIFDDLPQLGTLVPGR